MVKENKKTAIIFSTNLMKYLQSRGFDFYATRPAREDNSKILFFYDDSEELREAMSDYKNSKNK